MKAEEKSEKPWTKQQHRRWLLTQFQWDDVPDSGSPEMKVWKEKKLEGVSPDQWIEVKKHWQAATADAAATRIRYAMLGYEQCPETKKYHIHIYLELNTARTGGAVQKLTRVPNIHFDACKGSLDANQVYVKKDGVFVEFGEPARKKDAEYACVVDKIKDGADIRTLTEEHPELVIKNRKAVVDTISMFGAKSKHPLTDAVFAKRTPNPFQQGLIDHCEKMMSKYEDRKVIWIADPKGCTGKSSLVKFLKYKFGEENVIELGQGMTKDITYAWNGQRICVFDFSRTLEERINYNAIEAIKKGIVLSTKYESVEKWYDPPIVMCFANFAPDESTMTKDVWDIRWNSPPNSGQPPFGGDMPPFKMIAWPEIPMPEPQAARFPSLVDDEKKE